MRSTEYGVRILSALALGCLMAGCAMPLSPRYGGGTVGTGIGAGYSAGGKPPATGVSYFDLEGTLRDGKGKAVSGAEISVITSRDTANATTGPAGTFTVPIIAGPGESVIFLVRRGGREAEYRAELPPGTVWSGNCALRLAGASLSGSRCSFEAQ